MDSYQKYLEYKRKYLQLRKQFQTGGEISGPVTEFREVGEDFLLKKWIGFHFLTTLDEVKDLWTDDQKPATEIQIEFQKSQMIGTKTFDLMIPTNQKVLYQEIDKVVNNFEKQLTESKLTRNPYIRVVRQSGSRHHIFVTMESSIDIQKFFNTIIPVFKKHVIGCLFGATNEVDEIYHTHARSFTSGQTLVIDNDPELDLHSWFVNQMQKSTTQTQNTVPLTGGACGCDQDSESDPTTSEAYGATEALADSE